TACCHLWSGSDFSRQFLKWDFLRLRHLVRWCRKFRRRRKCALFAASRDNSTRVRARGRHSDFGQIRTLELRNSARCLQTGRAALCALTRRLLVKLGSPVGYFSYATLISICLGLAFSFLGRCTVSRPFLNSAFILLPSASSGRMKLRKKVPKPRSVR